MTALLGDGGHLLNLITCHGCTCGSLHHNHLNMDIKNADSLLWVHVRPLWVHMWAIIGSHEWDVTGIESRAVSTQVTKFKYCY